MSGLLLEAEGGGWLWRGICGLGCDEAVGRRCLIFLSELAFGAMSQGLTIGGGAMAVTGRCSHIGVVYRRRVRWESPAVVLGGASAKRLLTFC